MSKIRFGILGSGFMGRTHIEAIRRLPHAEVVAVTGGTRAPGLAEMYRIAYEPDDDALLRRRDIDAVVVTTPHHCHVGQTLAAAAAGKHVLVEKPLATSTEDCDRMIEAMDRAKRTLAVGYQQRFRINNAKACELIRAGTIGQVITAQISMPMYAGTIKAGGFGGNWAWWNDPANRAHLFNSSPHALDLIRWFTGADIVTVTAFSRTFLPDIPVEDTTVGLFALSSGAIGSLYSSRALPAPSFVGEEFRFRIVGTKGLIDLDAYTELKLSDETHGWQVMSRQPPVNHEGANTAFADVRMQAYRDQMAAFIDLIEGRPSVVGSAADGRAAVAACAGMLDASAQRRWIDLASQR
jgi:predicted dehydrogenase